MELRDFIFNGQKVPDICAERNVPFEDFDKRFTRMRNNKRLESLTNEFLIDYIFRTFYPVKTKTNFQCPCKYYVDDEKISEFATQNGMLSFSVRGAVQRELKKNPNGDMSKMAKDYVKRNKNKTIFMYENYPLTTACRMYNVSRASVVNTFYDTYPDHAKMTQEEKNAAVKEIFDVFRRKNNKGNSLKLVNR